MADQEPDDVVMRQYVDAGGTTRKVPSEVADAFEALVDVGEVATPLVVHPGDPIEVRGSLVTEGGGEIDIDGVVPADVPLGYHTIHDDDGERQLIVSPGRCFLPAGWRAWGWAVQLYAARSRRSWGMGDLSDLAQLARHSRDLGAGFVLVNPLRATTPIAPQEPSPYSPASRRFLNPIYLDVDAVTVPAGGGDDIEDLRAAGRALNTDRHIDRDAVLRIKLAALRRLFDDHPHDAAFDEWLATREDVREFAAWNVLVERHGPDWRRWPPEFRRPHAGGARQLVQSSDRQMRFHAWLQWLTERQLDRATGTIRVVQDLPIGFEANGMDAWLWQDLLAPGVSVGAPPDELNPAGQDWALPAFVPGRLAAAGYQPFIDTIRSSLVTDGGLRIDHVMGLFRLWWIPDGAGPADGAYVRYPVDDLLDIVALESSRHRAVVVGEDLGTVEPGARDALASRNLLSYRLLWFEDEPPRDWPARSMAAITTHDLPTVRGLWDGSDLETLHAIGVPANDDGLEEVRQRLVDATGLSEDAEPAVAVIAAHRALGEAPSRMLCATLDDLLVVAERPNVPGASADHPNWSLALPSPIETLADLDVVEAVSSILDAATRHPHPETSAEGSAVRSHPRPGPGQR